MGYELLKELLAYRPAGPGPEWWLLLDLALDADDVTRRTACGFEYMMGRTQSPRSTVHRWLKKLRDADLLSVAEKSAGGSAGRKGKRAVYEIQVPPALAERIAADLSRVSQKETRLPQPESTGRVSSAVGPVSAGNGSRVSSAVGPPIQDPLRAASVEGAGLRSDQNLISEDKEDFSVGPEREARRALAAQAGPQPQETETPMGPRRKRRPAA